LCDDHPGYPMTGFFRLRFSGFLDPPVFQAALNATVQRHPLLRGTIRKTPFRHPEWVDHPEWLPEIQWHAKSMENGFPQTDHLDPQQEPASRFWVMDRSDGNDFIAQVHHCCTDAQGMNIFFEDILICYAAKKDRRNNDICLRNLEPQRLLSRCSATKLRRKFLRMVRNRSVGLRGVCRFLMRSPVQLSGKKYLVGSNETGFRTPNPHAFEFDPVETENIFAAARKFKVNVNELLIRDLFLTCSSWRRERGIGNNGDWLRFSIPISLRTVAEERMPMANSFSMVFLDRQTADMADKIQLLRSISDQLQRFKQSEQGYTFLLSLAVTRNLPGGLARMVRKDTCYSTSCFSNIGRILTRTPLPRTDGKIVAGNLVLESIDFVIPVRPHMDVAFCAGIYAGRLRILMNRDPHTISEEQGRGLLEKYVLQIRNTVSSSQQ